MWCIATDDFAAADCARIVRASRHLEPRPADGWHVTCSGVTVSVIGGGRRDSVSEEIIFQEVPA